MANLMSLRVIDGLVAFQLFESPRLSSRLHRPSQPRL